MAVTKRDAALHELFTGIGTPKEAKELLSDLLTPQELESLAERVAIVRELIAGTPQREIAKKLGVSISKITRGSQMLQGGGAAIKKRLA